MSEPQLSAILNMAGDFATIRRTISALTNQTARDKLELIIVATKTDAATIDRAKLDCLAAVQIIEVDALPSGAHGWAEGIRRARSPIVVLAEDHSFPAANWAETLIDAHRNADYFAVTPAVANGNPATCTSWANFLLSFVDWFAPAEPKLVPVGAGHNTSYKRDVLLAEYGNALEKWLRSEHALHHDAMLKGRKILLDSRTSVSHVNISDRSAYLGISYAGGRVFGAVRSERWSLPRRWFYAAAFPLVPPLRLKRILGHLNTPQKRRDARFVRSLPLIMAGLFLHAAGEAMGNVFGIGRILTTYTGYELNRRDYLIPAERKWILDAAD